MSVTAVVLNYDGRALLEAILPTLAAQTVPDLQVLVVDNGSRDDSLEYLAREWPAVQVLAIPDNVGVTAALNRGIEAASTEFVALLNNDIELEPSALEAMVNALRAHPGAGSAAPKMLDHRDRGVLDGAGDMLNWRGGGLRRGHGQRDTGQFDRGEEVFGPCGGAAVYRLSALRDVGPLDERYFAYYEDLDWAFRAQLAGYACRYVPEAVVYHRGSATLGRGWSDFNGYHLWRNAVWLVAKNYPRGALLRHLPSLLRGQAGNLYVAVREKRFGVWRRAIRDALRGLPPVLRDRRRVQAGRTADLTRLERLASTGR